MRTVPQADAKSASMGWFFDPGFIHNVQRVAADIENPSMESIDPVLFALREMGCICVSGTCEHCVPAQDYAALLARHTALVEAAKPVAAWWRKERMVAEPPYQIEHLVLGTDGPECVGVDELDALAALVGDEK